MASIPHLNGLQAKFGQKGFNLFAFHHQAATKDELAKFCKDRGITYPVSQGGGTAFSGTGGIPVAWLIGVEGKIVWQGNPAASQGALDAKIKEEMAKIKYPGLGKLDVDAKVAPAAALFTQKQYDKARETALKLIEKTGLTWEAIDEAAVDVKALKTPADEKTGEVKEVELTPALRDAAFVVRRVKETGAKLAEKAGKHESAKDYLEASQVLTQIVTAFGKKADEGKAAQDKLDEWKKDKDIKKEIAAQTELVGLLSKLEKAKDDARAAQLDAFIKKYEGTRAAERAQAAK